jgi:hypothetical protein
MRGKYKTCYWKKLLTAEAGSFYLTADVLQSIMQGMYIITLHIFLPTVWLAMRVFFFQCSEVIRLFLERK